MRLVVLDKGLHSSFSTRQAESNSFNTPKVLGWLLMVATMLAVLPSVEWYVLKTYPGVSIWAVLQVMGQIPRGIQMSDGCLTSLLCYSTAHNHRSMPVLSGSMFPSMKSLRYLHYRLYPCTYPPMPTACAWAQVGTTHLGSFTSGTQCRVGQKEWYATLNPEAAGKPTTYSAATHPIPSHAQKQEWDPIDFPPRRAHRNSWTVECRQTGTLLQSFLATLFRLA